jgi:2-succinyl-5-enolpyruvyl-6-hydroxy-3-cyclohexene-1-carboxylate synthase
MTAPNRNSLWASIFVDELVRAGLKAVCIAPGSRSTPLTLAFAGCSDITVYSLLDERGAAFFALGLALAGQKPVALVCTSGTATANFYPAIIEANYAQAPLLVLTTDRPHEARHSGANQTIDQVKMYGDHVRWFVDVTPPEAQPSPATLRSLRSLACRAMAATVGFPPGPVHLNFPFRKPLEPIPVAGDVTEPSDQGEGGIAFYGRADNAPFTHIRRGVCLPTTEQLHFLTDLIQRAPRGLIVCGPRCPGGGFPQAVSRLAQAAGYPILADALSGVRFGQHVAEAEGLVLGSYESFLQPEVIAAWEPPDMILRFGAMPISQALGNYLSTASSTRQIAISESGTWQDENHMLTDFIWAEPEAVCRLGAAYLKTLSLQARDTAWGAAFQRAEEQARHSFESIRAGQFFEGALLADVVESMPPEALLYVASSMPVRHLDQFAPPRQAGLQVFANRGASGIDGTIASALGAAAATERPLVLVIGDLAFYHDLNSLLALRRCAVKATIVLINNNGGGIFHRLPIARFDPPFTDLFVTPHGLNFEPVVRMFGAAYAAPTTRADFRQALQQSIGSETAQVIEVVTDAALHEKMRQAVIKQTKERMRAVAAS